MECLIDTKKIDFTQEWICDEMTFKTRSSS